MNKEMIADAVNIINDRLLTPVIYYLDYGYKADFVCFFEIDVDEEEIYKTEEAITKKTGVASQVVDIREFEPFDAADIVADGELVYSENSTMEGMFRAAIMTELQLRSAQKEIFIERKNVTNTLYIQ